jgi:hypothetical protein
VLNPGSTHLPHDEFASSVHAALAAARNRDGGWGYRAGTSSRLEPTALALLALGEADQLTQVVARWPHRGGILLEPGIGLPNYAANALAALVGLSSDRSRPASWVVQLLNDLLAVKGRKTPAADPAINRQDNSLLGWPWVDDTFSWVEPTAWCVLALRRGLPHVPADVARNRIDEGQRLLLDRVCTPGGWNYGNSNVFRRQLPPYVPTTAVSLLALHGRRDRDVLRSADTLYERRLTEPSGLALGLTVMCLSVYGRPADDVREALAAQWGKVRYLGNITASALALYAHGAGSTRFEAFRA